MNILEMLKNDLKVMNQFFASVLNSWFPKPEKKGILTSDKHHLFVYEKTDENSLFAAAVCRKYTSFPIVEISDILNTPIPSGSELVWLGCKPTQAMSVILQKAVNYCLLPGVFEEPKRKNVIYVTSEAETITHLLYDCVLSHCLKNTDPGMVLQNKLQGAAVLVNSFLLKCGTQRSVCADPYATRRYQDGLKEDRQLELAATSFAVIHMAYNYMFYGKPFVSSILPMSPQIANMAINHYHTVLKETKALMETTVPRFITRQGVVTSVRKLDTVTAHWYMAKRLHTLNNTVLQFTRAIDGKVCEFGGPQLSTY